MGLRLTMAVLLILVAVSLPSPVTAELFQYTDKDGVVVIVDDESKVPPKYRKKARVSDSSASSGGERHTGVTVKSNRVIVPVTFSLRNNQVTAQMLLDTGASVTVISPSLAGRLGIRPEHTARGMGRIADGSFVESMHTRVDYIRVGPKVKQNAEVVVINQVGPAMGFDGLLGMNFLGDFRYHINMGGGTIEWQ